MQNGSGWESNPSSAMGGDACNVLSEQELTASCADDDAERRRTYRRTEAENCPELAAVVTAWPKLAEPIRAAILALVRTADGAK